MKTISRLILAAAAGVGVALALAVLLTGCGASAGEEFGTFRIVNATLGTEADALPIEVRGVHAALLFGQASPVSTVNNGRASAAAGGARADFDLMTNARYTVAFAGSLGVASGPFTPRVFVFADGAAPQLAAGETAVRLVHLSPDAPRVRLWRLHRQAGALARVVGAEAGYGQATGYFTFPAQETAGGAVNGASTFGVETPDGSFWDNPALENLDLRAGTTYTIYLMGVFGGAETRVLPD